MKLHERWALHHFDDESVLLDLEGGQYYVLNGTAAVIAGEVLAGRAPEAIAVDLARDYEVELERAEADARAVAVQLYAAAEESERGPLRFTAEGDRLALSFHGRPVARLASDGLSVEPAPTESRLELRHNLLAAAPHLLVLQHATVLHASSVHTPHGVYAFTGESGAGKTTLAHAVARHAGPLLSEDLCLVRFDGGAPRVLLDGEAHVRRWVESAAIAWEERRGALDARPLGDVWSGESAELAEVVFVDRARRRGELFLLEREAPSEVLVALLANAFAELDRRDVWRRVFERAVRLATEVPASRATVPDGLDALDRAVEAWVWEDFSST